MNSRKSASANLLYCGRRPQGKIRFTTFSDKRWLAVTCFASSYSFPMERAFPSPYALWLNLKRNDTIDGRTNEISAHSKHGFNRGAFQVLGHSRPDRL